MSLFTSITPTQQQQIQALQASIVNNNIVALQSLYNAIVSNWTTIWENENFTPQQIFDQFGTDAAELFSTGYAACVFIETIQPGSLDPKYLSPKYPYVKNADNTITVNAPAVVAPASIEGSSTVSFCFVQGDSNNPGD